MKRTMKIAIGILVVVIVLGVALQLVLKWRLGVILNRHVAPAVARELGVPLSVGGASLDLLRGRLTVDTLALGNPEGFSAANLVEVQELRLDMSLFELLSSGLVDIGRLHVRGGRLALERRADTRMNTVVLQERVSGAVAPGPAAEASGAPAAIPAPAAVPPAAPVASTLPNARVGDGSLDMTVTYVDYALDGARPLKLGLHEIIQFSGLGLGTAQTDWAPFTVRGGLEGNESVCATRLDGRLAPIADPARLSFDVSGEISRIDADFAAGYMAQHGISCSNLNIELRLSCRDGVFDETVSRIVLVANDLRLSPELAKKVPAGLDRFDRLSVPLGVRGTLQEPKTDAVQTVLLRTVLANVADNPKLQKALVGAVVDALGKSKKGAAGSDAVEQEGGRTNASAQDKADEAIEVGVDLLRKLMK